MIDEDEEKEEEIMVKVFRSTYCGVYTYFDSIEDALDELRDFAGYSREGDQVLYETVYMTQKAFNDILEWEL